MPFSPSQALTSTTALLAGGALGVLAPLIGAVGGTSARVADLVLAAGWSWAALAFCAGFSQPSKKRSALLAIASLVIAVVAYYVTKLGQGNFLAADLNDPSGKTTYINWFDFLSKMAVWCVAACILGPLLGFAGNLARNGRLRNLPFRIVVPVIAIIDTSQRLQLDAPLQGPTAAMTWSVIRLIAAASIVAILVHAVITSRSRLSSK
ncbi:DUF6518 family protein [Streptantibioticus rubrisoli]|uniref:DUF6518 family protein n=1 Tax=Streptantibioticus rubrisoli TaxID=1387313 RepID=A0ABT1PH24_9ACTN|nr:DUF6518 family protein [Streptantibioticus rubrisoli]MCQ4044659.1 DUF6518 family protein [Streptantibioticus rubrisoli]